MQLARNPVTPRLLAAAQQERELHLRELLRDTARAEALLYSFEDLEVDLSRQRLTLQTQQALMELAKAARVEEKRDLMFSGGHVNTSEDRSVLHTTMRDSARFATGEWQKLAHFVARVLEEKPDYTVVNIGIGGSDLGPSLVSRGLVPFKVGLEVHYVSNIDPAHLNDTLARCDPQRTLIVVTSKSFTTPETLANAALARAWLEAAGVSPAETMIAVTSALEKARTMGYGEEQIFAFPEGVGGRFSLWSAVGLPVMLGIGLKHFQDFLAGAHAMDRHFAEAELARNIPIQLALLRVWNRDFLGFSALAIMPYDQRLDRLPAWAQQLEMESNGKSVDIVGATLKMPASTLIWGEAGSNGQHSFFQCLHQGKEVIPIDVLLPLAGVPCTLPEGWVENHRVLAMNAIAQAETLAVGAQNYDEPHRHFPGNRPSSVMSWQQTTPYALGRVLALYEHITLIYGFIHHINSFDQWGVELGKSVAHQLIDGENLEDFSPNARRLVDKVNQISACD